MITLDNWELKLALPNEFSAPEQGFTVLFGNVSGHPRFKDDKYISTSEVLGRNGDYVVTRNTNYMLGNPSEEYSEQFPDAKAKLLNSLPEVELAGRRDPAPSP